MHLLYKCLDSNVAMVTLKEKRLLQQLIYTYILMQLPYAFMDNINNKVCIAIYIPKINLPLCS